MSGVVRAGLIVDFVTHLAIQEPRIDACLYDVVDPRPSAAEHALLRIRRYLGPWTVDKPDRSTSPPFQRIASGGFLVAASATGLIMYLRTKPILSFCALVTSVC